MRAIYILCPILNWLSKFNEANKKYLGKASLFKRIWAFRRGFFLETATACNINRENYRDYFSDRDYLAAHPLNGKLSTIIDNKLYLPFLLKDFPAHLPRYYYLIEHGRPIKLDPSLPDDMDPLLLCKQTGKLAVKLCSGSLGKGFHILEWHDGSFHVDSEPLESERAKEFIRSLNNYIVSEYIVQHHYSSQINESSANTVRLVCVRDDDTGAFTVISACHRFGRAGKYVDNLGSSGGGLLSVIDLKTGILTEVGLIRDEGKPEKRIRVTNHPDSKMPVAGVRIPNWEQLVDTTLKIMKNIGFIRYAGFDIIITGEGFKVNEINSYPSMVLMQVEGGVLRDKKFKQFLFRTKVS